MPDMFSELMATFFSNLMPWLILAWSMSAAFFISENKFVLKAKIISDESENYVVVALGFALICMLLPIRSCINRRVNKKEALDSDKTYKSLALTFSSDYDKENPLTIKAGQLRILGMQLNKAEASGD